MMSLHNIANLIVGFFKAMGKDAKVDDIIGYFDNAQQLYNQIFKIINKFMTLDVKNIMNLINAIEDVLEFVKALMAKL